MTTDLQSLRDSLKVPLRGRIDFRAVLGSSLADAIGLWKQGHFPMRRKVVHQLNFDDIVMPAGGSYAEVIDTRYKATHGVDFQAYKHTYDWATAVSGFEPAPGHFFGYDKPVWVEPHVYAVGDHGNPVDCQSLSKPNALNVSSETGPAYTQLLTNDNAIRINFDPPAAAVQMRCDYRISQVDKDKPIWNWPQMIAFDANGRLLDQDERPYGGTLTVSSWADDIAYVLVTVNNHWAGVEPYGIFDDLSWTTIEFVLTSMKKMRDAPPPVARSALVDQVIHRIDDVQRAQARVQARLAEVADADLATQLQAEMSAAIRQTESLMSFYRKITRDTANRSTAPVERASVAEPA